MTNKTKQLKTVTVSVVEYQQHCEEMDGVCLACGEWKYGDCEPDARNYECDDCGEKQVFGAEEAMMMDQLIVVNGEE